MSSILEKVMDHPSSFGLMVLNQAVRFMVPFNAPHGFRILKLADEEVQIQLPFKRKNLNHVKGIHAAALVTLGEFCAGLSLMKALPISKYRVILSKLSAEYLYQAKTNVTGNISISPEQIAKIKSEMISNGKTNIDLETVITDQNQNIVSKVQTTWQIKSWEQVKTKV